MTQINFTDKTINNLKPPAEKQDYYFDKKTPGFGVRVSYGGSKSWFLKYAFEGKQRNSTLGRYPAISLAEAKKRVVEIRHQIAFDETDPALQKKQERKALTLLQLCDLYIDMHAKVKKKSWEEDQRILNKYFAKLHQRKAADISRSEYVELFQNIMKNNGGTMSNRCLACIRKVYNFGIKNGYLEDNPVYLIDRPAKEISRDRVYSEQEIRKLWKVFDQCGIQGEIFKMCLITGQRLREVSGMQWSELDKLEVQNPVWTIPKERTKNGRTHTVPLSGLALKLLRGTKGRSDIWVFPSPKGLDQSVVIGSRNRNAVRSKSGISDFRPHDLRRTVETNITRLEFPRFIADRLLNHVEGGIGKVYDRYDYLKEKTEAMNAWSGYLSNQIGNKLFD